MKQFLKFARLPSPERFLYLRALLTVGIVRLGLWALPFQRLRGLVERFAVPPPGGSSPGRLPADTIARAVLAAERYIPRATCLTLSLAGYILFVRSGYHADLRIGVTRTEQGRLEAHAWMEYNGEVLVGDHAPGRYKTFERVMRV
jgi:hypothetical protein